MERTTECSIGIQVLSDHCPISLTFCPPYNNPSSRHWRLNSHLMSNPQFIDFITKELDFFLAVNRTPDVNPSILWETAKCYLRGSIISYTSAEKKRLLKTQLELEEKVKHLEEEFKSNPTESLGKLLDTARAALDQVLMKKAETSIFFCQTQAV